jgi:hypothetical protein
MTAAAVVGGTASALGGGKFANGAWSAAFVSRFNHDGSRHVFRSVRVGDHVYEVAHHSDGFGARACGSNAECLRNDTDLDRNHPKTKEWLQAVHAQGAREVGTMLSVAPAVAPTVRLLGASGYIANFVRATFGDFGGVFGHVAGISFRYRAIQLGVTPGNAVRVDAVTGTIVDQGWSTAN